MSYYTYIMEASPLVGIRSSNCEVLLIGTTPLSGLSFFMFAVRVYSYGSCHTGERCACVMCTRTGRWFVSPFVVTHESLTLDV